jgi:transcriptional repressor NrdR
VVDSRLSEPGDAVRRRRECTGCGNRFTTYERVEGVALTVVKRDGGREPFDRDKLLGGLLRAATKRPVQVPELEAVADDIAAQVRRGGGEVESELIGEHALRALIGLDRVAAIRFASVYRRFEDLAQFEAELQRLEREPTALADQLALGGEGATEAAGEGPVPSGSAGSIPDPLTEGRGEAKRTKRREHVAQP